MKVTSSGGSQFRWITLILFFPIIPIWIIGWMLYVVGSKITFRQKLTEKCFQSPLQRLKPKTKKH